MSNLVAFNNLTLLKGFRKVCFLFFLLGCFSINSLQAQTTITTVAGLKTMSMAGNYILSNDLDLSSEPNWTPIGTSGTPFTGTFDGNGKVIKGLQMNRPTTDNVGLFGYCKDAIIKNLGVEVASGVAGADNVGGLIGKYEKVSVTNGISGCYVTGIGSINGTGTVGGLVGWSNTTVTNCYATVNVTGYVTGGLVGLNYAGTVSYCYASGIVRGPYVGGVVGNNTDYSSSVKASITNCIANNPALSGSSSYSIMASGRIVAVNGIYSTISNCYALVAMTVNDAAVTGGTAGNKDGLNKTLTELQTQSTYSGWTFGTGGWAIWASNGFPYFQRQNAPANVTETTINGMTGKCAAASTPLTFYKQDGTSPAGTLSWSGTTWTYTFTTPIGLSDAVYVVAGATGSRSYFVTKPIEQVFCGGAGTAASPYLICDAEQLNAVRGQLDKYFKLNNDIDLTNWLAANSNVYGWEPIGTQATPFTGKFDGNEFSVKGLWINRGDYNVGLFGYVSDNNANIKDLGVQVDAKGVKGFYPVGGLVGTLFAGKIENCYASMGTVTGENNNIGGLVGANTWGTITGSYASCKVVGTEHENVGGLVGLNQATISNCYATGEVNASRGGGLVGNNAGTISYCYASGNVLKGYDNSGNPIQSYAGGGLADQNSGTISSCVAANNAIYGNPYAARAVCVPNGNVSNNYALSFMTLNGSIAGDANYNGTGKTQTELQTLSTYSGLGWDFASSGNTSGIWTIWEGGSYPFFQRQGSMVKTSSSCGTVLYVETRAGSDALGNPIQIDEVHAYKEGQLLAKGSRVGLSTIWAFTFPGSQGGNTLGIYAYEYNKKVSAASSILINPSASSTSNEYTIGGTGTNNYATLQDAADAYNTCGISQDVTFKIVSDLTLTKTVEFLGTAPGSGQFTLTISADGVTPRKVSGNLAGPLIHLFAANNIVIDGKASSDPLVKNLVFENTATTTVNHLVRTVSVDKRVVGCDDGINGCGENDDVKGKNIVIRNVELRLTSSAVFNVFGTANLVVTTDEITVENCLMNEANENVIVDRVKKLVFKDNILKGAVNTGLSVNAYYPDTYTITGNLFADITGTNAALYNNTLQVQGINIASAGFGTFHITGNTIKNIRNQATAGSSGAYGILAATDGTLNISENTIESITSVATNPDYDAYGINCLLYGSAVANVQKNEISNVSNIYTPFGILLQTPDGSASTRANVEINTISGIISQGGTTVNVFDAAGIRMEVPGVVSANKISGVKAPKGLAVGITGMQNFSVNMANAPLVSNNMIFDIDGLYSSGLQFSNENDFYKVCHNTVRITPGGPGKCLVVGNDNSKRVTVEAHNNLFSNEATGTAHMAVQIYGGTAADLQNNRYYAASGIIGQAPSGVLFTNINKWNTVTGDNSVVVKPVFAASGDLHLAASSLTDARLAVPLLAIVDSDFDGHARVACLNAAGADNFTANPEFRIGSITTTPPACEGEQTSVLFEIVGCSAPFQYSLDDKTTFTAISVDSITLTGEAVLHFETTLPAGNHTLWLKDGNGCQYESATVAITANSVAFPTGTTVFVKQAGTGTGDGSSWDNAFDGRYLAQYLKSSSLAAGTQIYVAAGTYFPYLEGCDDAATARTNSFELNKAVKMYGGFPANATGTTTNNANYQANITRLSGDIGVVGNVTDNSYNVVRITNASSILNGFYVSGGNADGAGAGQSTGGGIYGSAAMNLSNIVVENNTAKGNGGGIYAADMLALSGNNTVSYNKAGWTGTEFSTTAYTGGGIHAEAPLTELTDTLICKGNVASGSGGGIYKTPPSSAPYPVTFTATGLTLLQVDGNESKTSSGGGLYTSVSVYFSDLQKGSSVSGNKAATAGGGIYADISLTLNNTVVSDNTASGTDTGHSGLKPVIKGGGGGICAAAISSTVTLNNCTINNNKTGSYGGGLYFVTTQSAPSMAPTLNGCTVTNNTAGNSGGGVFAWGHLALKGENNISYNKAGWTGTGYTGTATGGGISANDFALNVVDTLICKGNVASGFGGGIYKTYSSNGSNPFNITNLKLLVVEDNESKSAGGGIYTTTSFELVKFPKGSSISSNRAGTTGGGIQTGGTSASNEHLVRLVLNNLTISNNTAAQGGGGVFAAGPLTLNGNNTVSGNKAGWTGTAYSTSTTHHGGGIHTKAGLTLVDTLVCNGNGASGNGGGIYKVNSYTTSTPYYSTAFNVANLKSLQVDGNTANAAGGGIYTADILDLGNLEKCSISGNTAKTTGGGIHAIGTLTLNNAVIYNNTAIPSLTATNSKGGGGGIFVDNSLTLTNSEVNNNTVSGNVSGTGSIGGGGGIFVTGVASLQNVILNNNIASNTGVSYGGGIYAGKTLTLSNVAVSYNAARSHGGGIYSVGALTLNDQNTVSENKAGWDGTAFVTTAAYGGGVCAMNNLILSGTLICNKNAASSFGGGIFKNTATATIDATGLNVFKLNNNEAGKGLAAGGGGAYLAGSATVGADFSNATSVEIIGNTASSVGGGIYSIGTLSFKNAAIRDNAAASSGGGIYASASLTLNNTAVSGNKAGFNAYTETWTGGSGGGIYAASLLTLTGNDTVSDNVAVYHGGGIYAASSLTLSGKNTISNNKAGWTGTSYAAANYYGGGIYANGNFTLSDTLICNYNGTALVGGGLYKGSGVIDATRLKFLQLNYNKAGQGTTQGGGGAYLNDATITNDFSHADSIEIIGNAVTGGGGGIFSVGPLRLKNAVLSNNTAGSSGGAIYVSADFQSNANTFAGNKAANGGGVYLNSTATVINNTFSANTATTNGGAVYANTSVHNISLSTFNGNTPSAVYFAGSANQTLNGNILYGNGTQEMNIKPATANYNMVRNMDLGATNRNVAAGKADSIFAVISSGDLATLADNGGPTQTLLITKDGLAHDFIPNSVFYSWNLPEVDQHGLLRPFGCKTDAGAVELQEEKQLLITVGVTGAAVACTGDEVLFTGDTGYDSYSWSGDGGIAKGNGDTHQEYFKWTTGGTKTVTYTVVAGTGDRRCERSGTTTIEISLRPETGPLYRVPNLQ